MRDFVTKVLKPYLSTRDDGGERIQKSPKLSDVIYGPPLRVTILAKLFQSTYCQELNENYNKSGNLFKLKISFWTSNP